MFFPPDAMVRVCRAWAGSIRPRRVAKWRSSIGGFSAVWIGVLVTSLVGLPCLSMLVVACVHWVRAARARRRDIKAGFVVYTNRFSAWVDYHGIGVGLALVAILLAVGVWLLSYLAGHGVKLGRGY
jgi:hypothetical protein